MTHCRFAPSTTGHAHPGTVLAALLAALDCHLHGGQFIVRFEDLDTQRCRPEYENSLREMLQWMSIDWDISERQSDCLPRYEHAMDQLAEQGLLYACSCSRSDLKHAPVALDGGRVYPGTCREHILNVATWRDCTDAIRFRLADRHIDIYDEGQTVLSQNPLTAMGDPVLRRKDGAYAYHLVAVVDDAAQGITRIIRGRDIAHSTGIHCVLQNVLGYARPVYRHHFLLLEARVPHTQNRHKFAKLRQSISWSEISSAYTADELRGVLAHACALIDNAEPLSMQDVHNIFSWDAVRTDDVCMQWVDRRLQLS